MTGLVEFVTEIAQLERQVVTEVQHYDNCSRCPGEVPSSPWCLTGSGANSQVVER